MKYQMQRVFWSVLLLVTLLFVPVSQVQAYQGTNKVELGQLINDAVERFNATSQGDIGGIILPPGSRLRNLQIVEAADGSVTMTGVLDEAEFLVKFPPNWNRQIALYAHGYTSPGTNRGLEVSSFAPQAAAILGAAYQQGFAYGLSAYSKLGYAVENGIKSTQALKGFTDYLKTERTYIVGVSMGGNILMGLIEKYPTEYAGGIAYCGVMGGWYEELRYLFDFRLVYDYFTKSFGAPLALPGAGSALIVNPDLTDQLVANSVVSLFVRAASDPAFAKIIQQISKVTGANPDIISFVTALAGGSGGGSADYLSTTGGNGYTNIGKRYTGSDNDDALNAGIERIEATPKATDYLNNWYTPTGKFQTKTLSIHNLIDPLVPYEHQAILKARVVAQNTTAYFVQQVVDANPVNATNPTAGGPTHCFFNISQFNFAWNQLRNWVEQSIRPEDDLNITKK